MTAAGPLPEQARAFIPDLSPTPPFIAATASESILLLRASLHRITRLAKRNTARPLPSPYALDALPLPWLLACVKICLISV